MKGLSRNKQKTPHRHRSVVTTGGKGRWREGEEGKEREMLVEGDLTWGGEHTIYR